MSHHFLAHSNDKLSRRLTAILCIHFRIPLPLYGLNGPEGSPVCFSGSLLHDPHPESPQMVRQYIQACSDPSQFKFPETRCLALLRAMSYALPRELVMEINYEYEEAFTSLFEERGGVAHAQQQVPSSAVEMRMAKVGPAVVREKGKQREQQQEDRSGLNGVGEVEEEEEQQQQGNSLVLLRTNEIRTLRNLQF